MPTATPAWMLALACAATVPLVGCRCGANDEPASTTLVVRVTDRDQPVGARVLLLRGDEPVRIGSLDLYGMRQGGAACAIAPGVVGSWDGLILATGTGEIPIGADGCAPSPAIPYGRYRVVAWRGVEYERWEGEVDLSAGRGAVELAIPLTRAWTPHGTLAADLHVHAFASKNDSSMPNPQRVTAQLAAGIQVVGLSDHNVSGDLDAAIAELGVGDRITSIAGNELTSSQAHVNVYPVVVTPGAPHGGGPPPDQLAAASAEQLFAIARGMPGGPVVQLNHPRFRVTALYDGRNWDGVAWPPPFPILFDAVEVLAGYSAHNAPGDRRLDDSARDYLTLVDHGHLITPLGNSDTHDFNWVLDGAARTYVFVDEPRVAPFDEAAFIAALRGRRVVATTGPWLDVEVSAAQGQTPTVGPGGNLRARGTAWIDVTLAQARFVGTERIRIVVGSAAGPRLAQLVDVPADVASHHWAGSIELGVTDTYIVVTADGDRALPVEQTGTYQRDKWKRDGITPYAITGPILIDVDGDGRWVRGDANLALP